jgi:hypothetical protein
MGDAKLCIRLPCSFAANLKNCYARQVHNVAAHVLASCNSEFLLADIGISCINFLQRASPFVIYLCLVWFPK